MKKLSLILALFIVSPLFAQDKEEDIRKNSLPLRTALHHDPTLKAPLDQLATLFRGANRLEVHLSI